MSEESSSSKKPIWQAERLPVALDGKEYIAVCPTAITEIGRLLHGDAKTPFTAYGFDNPNTEGCEWETYYDLAKTLAPTWASEHDSEVPTLRVTDKLKMFMRWKIEQNWFIKDLFVDSKLPIVFVGKDIVDGHYRRLICHDWLQRSLVSLRHDWLERNKKLDKIANKKNRKGGL